MKRQYFDISLNGAVVATTFAWNSAIREIERLVRERAREVARRSLGTARSARLSAWCGNGRWPWEVFTSSSIPSVRGLTSGTSHTAIALGDLLTKRCGMTSSCEVLSEPKHEGLYSGR